MRAIEPPASGGPRQARGRKRMQALSLCFVPLIVGCGPRLATKADDAAQMANPMLNASYAQEAEVPFVMEPTTARPLSSGRANFGSETASRRTRETADWVVASRDNLNMPFAIVDKVNAKVYAFSVDGQLKGAVSSIKPCNERRHPRQGPSLLQTSNAIETRLLALDAF